MSTESRIMGLDVGDVRIGIAISDELRISASPHSVIVQRRRAPREVVKLVELLRVEVIAVGMPYELSGQVGEQGRRVELFVRELTHELRRKQLDVRVEFVDERLTSREAERVIAGSGLRDEARKQAIDKVAAAIILQAFLETNGSRCR